MPLTTKHWKWKESAKAANVCAKGSIRTVKITKRHGKVYALTPYRLVRTCCPKKSWKGGYCQEGMVAIAWARPRGPAGKAKKFAGSNVTIPRAHLREDIREAKAMIKELKSGVKRDQAALTRRKR